MSSTSTQAEKGGGGRTLPEWITFGVATTIILALVAILAFDVVGPTAPAAPEASITGGIEERAGAFHVPVAVVNRGDHAAAQVAVVAELEIDGKTTEADQTIDFLAGREEEGLLFVFDDDPSDGRLTVRVSGYATP